MPEHYTTRSFADRIYDRFVEDNDDEGRLCRDIPDDACHEQPMAFTFQLVAQTLTKLADALVSPRLVLAWMMSALGSPVIFIALLVPVRESLSLIPQLFIARYLREQPLRKAFWVIGAMGQALALAGMIPAILLLEGYYFGGTIIALLAAFSMCRGICSVSSKDVLGKTISKSRRGRLNGLAASASGIIILLTALVIAFHNQLHLVPENSQFFFVTLIAIAASLWIISASVYIRIPELPGATAGGGSAIKEAFASLMLLRNDAELRNFVIARSLMIAVAVAIPYIVLLIQRQSDGAFNNLGALLLAEGLAALISGHVWGKWSDTASHRVMGVAAALSALLFAIVILIQLSNSSLLGIGPIAGMVLFIAAACHQGIRIARKTYLVDIATSENRASYVAVSNTVIGILIAASGFFAIVDASYGTVATLGLLCLLSSIGAAMAFRLKPATA